MPSGTLLVCFFHLNLAFSSLDEERHPDVIERCYWPMLELAGDGAFPIGIEASGWTLARIAALDESWIERCRELAAAGSLEVVGSGWSQCAAPLLPAELNAWNLTLGRDAYAELLGVKPRLALVAEQAYSPGLVDLYREAGYDAIVVDWENAYRSHPEWPDETRRFPQRARGPSASMPLVWSQSIAFQKFQRFAHGELSLDDYLAFVEERSTGDGGVVLYGNDAEVFDHRPGRFAAEPPPSEASEWARIREGLTALAERGVGVPALPSRMLDLLDAPEAGHELALEAPDQPVPVKKQDKYNVSRWACTGRDDTGINTRCWRLFDALRQDPSAGADAWRELCELWASDFRTHITESRWTELLDRLAESERRWLPAPDTGASPGPAPRASRPAEGERHELRADGRVVVLNGRRGLAVSSYADAAFGDEPLFGTLPHGYFDDIALGADFYTGHTVQEAPGEQKVADLEPVAPQIDELEDGGVRATGRVQTRLGPVRKSVSLEPDGSLALEYALEWPELPPGSLRLGHVTLFPRAFRADQLWYACHNGGRTPDVHRFGTTAFDHGLAVSALVSCRQGLGVTEGALWIGDGERALAVEVDQTAAKPLGLVTFQPAAPGYLCRVAFSLAENDDTRRGAIPRAEPQRLRLRITPVLTAGLPLPEDRLPAQASR